MPEGFEQLTLNWRSALTGSIILCSLLAAAFLLRRRVEPTASLALATFVALSCLAAVPTLIGFAGAYGIWPGLTFLPTETFLFLGPLILIHAHSLMVGPPTRVHLWLLAPGMAYWLYQFWAFTMLGDAEAKWAYGRAFHAPYVFPVVTALTWAMLAGCVAYVFVLRRRYIAWLKDNHADNEPFDPTWLRHFVAIAVAATVYWIGKSAVSIWYELGFFQNFAWDFIALFVVFLIALEALVGIHQRFPKMALDPAPEPSTTEPIAARDWTAEGEQVRKRVIEKQWFLEPGLSLQILSRRYGMNHVYLSRAINDGLGCNFNGFINSLRVDHAKALIEAGDQRSLTEIALAAGFGSKASFNRAFKLHAGISPSEHRSMAVS
ncbi:MAG: helix-turn-helix domain-containing protein, partial [Pseudomonadota bacterium]